MASSHAIQRLRKEYLRLQKEPVALIEAAPLDSNILEWHYVIRGPADSPYSGGYFHGKIKFPSEYPYKPPSIMMITPSGRFKPNTRLCLTMSDFHPESWNPLWSVSSILTGLQSFMLENTPTVGSMDSSDSTKRSLAQKSLAFNMDDPVFVKLFPHYQEIYLQHQQDAAAAAEAKRKVEAAQPLSRPKSDADLAANSGVVQVNGKAEADDKAQTPKAQRIDWLEYLLIALVVAVVAMAISYVY